MASYDFDQAEGLRRMLAGPKPRVLTLLSATSDEEKSATLVNLGASLVKAGSQVALIDARSDARGIAARLNVGRGASLMDVVRRDRTLQDAIQAMPQGFGVVALTKGGNGTIPPFDTPLGRRLADTFGQLAGQVDMLMVDGELDADDVLPIPAMANGNIVVQVSTSAASIKAAYALIKRLNAQLGRRPFGVLVTGATDEEAQVVYENIAKASNRYLAVQLDSLGSVPADEHLKRAARLGRSVVDAFPLAGASVAFRRLAERVAAADVASGLRSMMHAGSNMVV